ncbi:K(lysine) acetyltransferase, partial [Lobosporangium transversale]
DKRLDEWVDITRLLPLSTQPSNDEMLQDKTKPVSSQEGRQETSISPSDTSSESHRPKRKIVKDEVALLLESLKSAARKTSGDAGQERNTGGYSHHGHDHDDEELPRVRNVEWILYAGYDIATWYYSPFPEEYQDCQRLFICEYCLKYIRQVDSFINHTKNCKRKRPPGTVVYSKGINKIYKVDGKTNKLYCQNLSLLAKLFLDNKTLYFDIHGFHFFVLTETRSDRTDVPVGFFSKEIVSYDGYNLACILILPPFQRKSYGKLLIEFSYELTKIEGKVGSPEKPLSDLGKLGYMSYWITAILRELYPKPWPAKRVMLPTTARRKGKSTAKTIQLGSSSHSVQSEQSAVASTKAQGKLLPAKQAIEDQGPGPMDVDIVSPVDGLDKPMNDETQENTNEEIALSLRELAARTGIMEEDLLETLVTMGWMTHWLSLADQAASATVKNAKRRYRKLIKFNEQQQLLEKYGVVQEPGTAGQQDGHRDYDSGPGQFPNYTKLHVRQLSGANASGSINSAVVRESAGMQQHQSGLMRQRLTHEVDPVSILEIPESDDEESQGDPFTEQSTVESSLGTSGLKDVAVVTLEMVKDYQYRHNIRLDPYLDWNAIDWVAYRSTLEQ